MSAPAKQLSNENALSNYILDGFDSHDVLATMRCDYSTQHPKTLMGNLASRPWNMKLVKYMAEPFPTRRSKMREDQALQEGSLNPFIMDAVLQ